MAIGKLKAYLCLMFTPVKDHLNRIQKNIYEYTLYLKCSNYLGKTEATEAKKVCNKIMLRYEIQVLCETCGENYCFRWESKTSNSFSTL